MTKKKILEHKNSRIAMIVVIIVLLIVAIALIGNGRRKQIHKVAVPTIAVEVAK